MDPSDRRYHPGLDGVRAVAVALVLVFHSGLGWVDGGFLGVSVFFTLSGFLITSLLLDEVGFGGHVSLRRFWGRRVRRLGPASLACLLAIALVGPALSDTATRHELGGDVLAALCYVANWRFVIAEQSYAELFAAPSPVLHFWSLAIEEQFYLLFPLLIAGLAALGWRRRGIGVALVALTAASTWVTLLLDDRDRIYYGTDTRATELLVGGVLACVAGTWLRRQRPTDRSTRAVSIVGSAALGAITAISIVTTQADAWLYSGGLAAFAVLSAALVAAAVVPGPTRWLLSLRPLPAVGRVSYGLYLYHWPVFVWLSEGRIGFGGVRLFVVQLAVTTVVAVASYHLLERPIRERRRLPRAGPALAAFSAGVLVLVAAVVVAVRPAPTSADDDLFDEGAQPVLLGAAPVQIDDASGAPESVPAPAGDATASSSPATIAAPDPAVVLVLGSNPTLAAEVAARPPAGVTAPIVADHTTPACPVYRAAEVDGEPASATDCPDFRSRWVELVAATRADAVVVGVGERERAPYRLDPDETTWRTLGSSQDTARLDELAAAVELLDALAVPAFLHDAGPVDDAVATAVREARAAHPSVGLVEHVDDLVWVSAAAAARASTPTASVPRLLVVGDSTARNVAAGLADGADGRVEVVSAGVVGCPLVRTSSVRPRADEDRSTAYCPTWEDSWSDWVEAFEPDAIVAVAGPAEQWEQQYPGIDGWHLPGSATYQRWHDDELARMIDVLGRYGLTMLVLEAPEITSDHGDLGAEPGRVEAWNAQIQRWDATWIPVRTVAYASLWSDPRSKQGRAERPDGVHATAEQMARVAREHLVPEILAELETARSEMRATGCLVGVERTERLYVGRCRLAGTLEDP